MWTHFPPRVFRQYYSLRSINQVLFKVFRGKDSETGDDVLKVYYNIIIYRFPKAQSSPEILVANFNRVYDRTFR